MSYTMPNSIEIEKIIIGGVVAEGSTIGKIEHIISYKDFYDEVLSSAYKILQKMHNNREDINIVTASERLRDSGYLELIGGASGLSEMTTSYITPTGIVSSARILAEKSMQRRILSAAAKIASITQKNIPIDEMVAELEETTKGISRSSILANEKLSMSRIQDFVDDAVKARPARGQIQGLSTGFFDVDEMTKGFVPGELMVLSGHTSHGKTQLATNIAYRVAATDKPVLFVTMEMTKVEMTQRLLSIADDKITETLPIYFQSRTDLAYTDIGRLVERAKEKGVELVVIDHLHYFSRSIENSTAEISKIVKEFKQAAIENNMPIILISHVRKMDTKKRPSLQDIRDSSLIAQDSDMVLIVWRDTSIDSKTIDEVEVLILKNRNRGLHIRRKILYSDEAKLTEKKPEPRLEYNPDAMIEGGQSADLDYTQW